MTDINLGDGIGMGSDALISGATAFGGALIGSWFSNGWGGWGNRNNVGTGVEVGIGATNLLNDNLNTLQGSVNDMSNRLIDSNYQTNMNLVNAVSSAHNSLNTTIGGVGTNTQLGFAQVQNTLAQGFAGLNTAISSQGYENRLATNDLASRMQDCCCGIKTAVGEQGAMTRQLMQDIYAQSQAQALCDAKAKISSLESQISFNKSQAEQTAYLISQLKTPA